MHISEIREQILLLSPYLKGWVQIHPNLWNARCPVCGDSKSSETKKRFYIYQKSGSYSVKCHNCGYSAKFMTFYREYFPAVYEVNVMTKYKPDRIKKKKAMVNSAKPSALNEFITGGYDYTGLTNVTDLPTTHPAVTTLIDRKIPKNWWNKHFLYTENFTQFLIDIGDRERSERYGKYTEPRLIIPFYDKYGVSRCFQGRSLEKNPKLRYITVKQSERASKIWGLDRIDPKKPVLVLEGAIDAMFLPQAIAMSGSLVKMDDNLEKIYVLDNEPRNRDICDIYQKLLRCGHKIVLWPRKVKQKDINDMILAGYTVNGLLKIIFENVVYGMEGDMKLNEWRMDRK